jgi:predicted nucleotidyltransferase
MPEPRYVPGHRLDDDSLHDAVPNWIRKWVDRNKIKLQRAMLFGSIVHEHYPTSDVDVIFFSEPVSKRQATVMGRKIKTGMRDEFQRRFGHRLHVQLFLHTEAEGLKEFLAGLSKYEDIQIKGE